MRYLYHIGIQLFVGAIKFASLFNEKAYLWVKGRRNWKVNLSKAVQNHPNVYWFHAASLGEFEQARPLMERIKAENPSVFLLLTFFSPSGYEIRKNYEHADYVCYLPADTIVNAKNFIKIIQAKKAFFIKYEFWFNYMRELHRHQVDLYLISGVFRPRQMFFKVYGTWFRKQLKAFHFFFLQDDASQKKLNTLGYSNSIVTGDTRFDRVINVSENPLELPQIERFVNNKPCLVVGSSWPKEEILITDYINRHPQNKYIVAPHEVDEAHIRQIIGLLKTKTLRWSEAQNQDTIEDASVLIIDQIGILNSVYRFADIAYVGGGFGTGLHNILEPAVYGVPVIFGNQHSKFPEAYDLIDAGGGFSVHNQTSLNEILDTFFQDDAYRKSCGDKSKSFIYKGKGACDKIWETINLNPF